MRKGFVILAAALLSFVIIGCEKSTSDFEKNALKQSDMERKLNEEALKKNPPPPGDGPGN